MASDNQSLAAVDHRKLSRFVSAAFEKRPPPRPRVRASGRVSAAGPKHRRARRHGQAHRASCRGRCV
jgi:hypothetical protein